MLPTVIGDEFIARSTRMPHFPVWLSTSALSHHDLSLAGFITNIAECDFFGTHTRPRDKAECCIVGEGGLLKRRTGAPLEPMLVAHRRERAFDDIGRTLMLPVFCRKVIEGGQCVSILD
jgi:hypothetical protein